ncbi:hypothetical protein LguiB_001692 [Lonicera macranthoides]
MESIINKICNFDAYPKINEDFYGRTLSGGVITRASSIVMHLLFFSELTNIHNLNAKYFQIIQAERLRKETVSKQRFRKRGLKTKGKRQGTDPTCNIHTSCDSGPGSTLISYVTIRMLMTTNKKCELLHPSAIGQVIVYLGKSKAKGKATKHKAEGQLSIKSKSKQKQTSTQHNFYKRKKRHKEKQAPKAEDSGAAFEIVGKYVMHDVN